MATYINSTGTKITADNLSRARAIATELGVCADLRPYDRRKRTGSRKGAPKLFRFEIRAICAQRVFIQGRAELKIEALNIHSARNRVASQAAQFAAECRAPNYDARLISAERFVAE